VVLDGRVFAVPKQGGSKRELSRSGYSTELAARDGAVYVALEDSDESKIAAIAVDAGARTIVGCLAGRSHDLQVNATAAFLPTDAEVRSFALP
jgi:hypothetical protein